MGTVRRWWDAIAFWYAKKRHRVIREGDIIAVDVDGERARITKHTRTRVTVKRP